MEPEITVSSIVNTHENIALVEKSIKLIFPDWEPNFILQEDSFPVTRDEIRLSGKSQSLIGIIEFCRTWIYLSQKD